MVFICLKWTINVIISFSFVLNRKQMVLVGQMENLWFLCVPNGKYTDCL